MKGLRRIASYFALQAGIPDMYGDEVVDTATAVQIVAYFSMLPIFLRWKRNRTDSLTVGETLTPMVGSESSIPHDHFYAVLGLIHPEDGGAISVDYALPYSMVLLRCSTHMAMSNQLDMLLSLLSPHDLHHPSWVFDPEVKLEEVRAQENRAVSVTNFEEVDVSKAGGDVQRAYVDKGGTLLYVDGILLGSVDAATSTTCPWLKPFEAIRLWCLNHQRVFSVQSSQRPNHTIYDFWMTLCAGGRLPATGHSQEARRVRICR